MVTAIVKDILECYVRLHAKTQIFYVFDSTINGLKILSPLLSYILPFFLRT